MRLIYLRSEYVFFNRTDKFICRSDSVFCCIGKQNMIKINNHKTCKGKCVDYKAKKPINGGCYSSGQFRCQICEIYLMSQGVKNNRFCKCCNYRIRTKPRNSKYKEKYHERIGNITDPVISVTVNDNIKVAEIKSNTVDNNWWLEESTKKRIEQELENNKKTTPIYEKADESVKTYYEFKEFLESEIELKSNYQLVMLKELLEYGKLHKGEISESIAYFNNKDSSDINTVKQFFNVPIYDDPLKHGIITFDEHNSFDDIPCYSLNVKLEDFQRIELIYYLTNEITAYNKEHHIPENNFSDADNMTNIEWSISNIKSLLDTQKLLKQTLNSKPETEEVTTKIVKQCPRCNDTKVEGFSGAELDEKIEELFGYRQLEPGDLILFAIIFCRGL